MIPKSQPGRLLLEAASALEAAATALMEGLPNPEGPGFVAARRLAAVHNELISMAAHARRIASEVDDWPPGGPPMPSEDDGGPEDEGGPEGPDLGGGAYRRPALRVIRSGGSTPGPEAKGPA